MHLNSGPERTEKLEELARQAAAIFSYEPMDAADYKDAAGKIYDVWTLARELHRGDDE